MQTRYRQDYTGEFVVVESKWANGKKQQRREWVANPIDNQQISNRAACIGSLTDIEQFNPKILEKHRGGLLSSKKLQTYGTAEVANIMSLDFTVDITYKHLEPLVENNYVETNVVYATARTCIEHPGEFYLIPQNPHFSTLALPIYLAAFDGHKEIFMLGYHTQTTPDQSEWISQVADIIKAYSGIMFTMVGVTNVMPAEWMKYPNTKNLTYREFIYYCDI